MKPKYLVRIPADYLESQYFDWNDKTPFEQNDIARNFMVQMEAFLASDRSGAVFDFRGGISISQITPSPRIRLIRSAGMAIKY